MRGTAGRYCAGERLGQEVGPQFVLVEHGGSAVAAAAGIDGGWRATEVAAPSESLHGGPNNEAAGLEWPGALRGIHSYVY